MIARLLKLLCEEVFDLMKLRPDLYRLWIALDDARTFAREADL